MSTKSPRPQDSAILGESWVVTSSPSSKQDKQTNRIPSDNADADADKDTRRHADKEQQRKKQRDDSMTTSASSMSGPELIMPSIYEAPVSERSWVAPTVRSRGQSIKRRQAPSSRSGGTTKSDNKQADTDADASSRQETRRKGTDGAQARSPKLNPIFKWLLQGSIRAVINVLLVAAISHMLVVPELVQQYQTLCSIATISNLYPASCIPPFPQPQPIHHRPASKNPESVLSSQEQLGALFNGTLHGIAPLSGSLKQSESQLRDIQTELRRAYPGTKHELDLEFDGCWQATRTATHKFDSLKADLRSALDNLVATSGGGPVAQDSRFSTQMSRREQYLDQLTARMQSKADSLSTDLATLDDHLESIGSIVAREDPSSASILDAVPEPHAKNIRKLVDSILPEKLPLFSRRPNQDSAARSDLSISELFQAAASQHRPVADAVRNLSHRLIALQKRRAL